MSGPSGELWLSRIRLRREAPVAALARLLVPEGEGARTAAGHHLIWSVFSDGPERRRDFLWREEAPGRFLALSARRPEDATGLFTVESRPFEPALAPGDRLGFALRANPVVSRTAGPGRRGQRHDVVMDALRHVPPGPERAEARPATILSAGRAWLAGQGERHGFRPDGTVAVDGYERRPVPREGGGTAVLGVLEFEGVLTVEDPARFLAALAAGFGKARAFGLGLMLIRRDRR
ncbi:type I-E CRISPR-associated protein Cas6/Cse3/CasE [Roseomonas sp. OT10]|uniref:type I-E CRISPR-associated protein Cas6/Cse3/CasE n=1 Tax=Roseomonas cutis TaxID=2897332 RepID=UPI001E5B8B85|nr:type I-E CRISPR-associated protein Cas6/Cse3/CasE [Roseomonas sp. OT10]UFN49153.1 type I-E CRISPR-associated protein Cas6/Cse3/CasE [Roseomonas sp. OT10]